MLTCDYDRLAEACLTHDPAMMPAPRDPICRRCDEPASAHCPDCSACPHNDCPEWCEPQDD